MGYECGIFKSNDSIKREINAESVCQYNQPSNHYLNTL